MTFQNQTEFRVRGKAFFDLFKPYDTLYVMWCKTRYESARKLRVQRLTTSHVTFYVRNVLDGSILWKMRMLLKMPNIKAILTPEGMNLLPRLQQFLDPRFKPKKAAVLWKKDRKKEEDEVSKYL